MSKALGLPDDWVVKVIKAVGNYEELWNRNFGPLGLQRGLNRLLEQGGPPVRSAAALTSERRHR